MAANHLYLTTVVAALVGMAVGQKAIYVKETCWPNDVYTFAVPPKTSEYDQTLYEVVLCSFRIGPLKPGSVFDITIPPVRSPCSVRKTRIAYESSLRPGLEWYFNSTAE